jgi:hypothetical protein
MQGQQNVKLRLSSKDSEHVIDHTLAQNSEHLHLPVTSTR